MLQRAASNAYSWWMASHIRTKQSKWLEQSLQDMEEKVASVLKLIEEDGDSFARRAEMYYKKRPELIHFVEESYRAYRALAERYDHISTELQNANNTIAAVFPEQVQFMDDEDEDGPPSFPKKPSDNVKGNVPKVPKLPMKELKGLISSATKKIQPKKSVKAAIAAFSKSGLTKAEGLSEIDRLQKRILALQTEKEFVKSSYDAGLAKYWEIENEIKQMQEKVGTLQDEFGEGRIIEDDEARNLMASTALQSCKQTLDQLQEKQERSVMEAEVEQERIKEAREKLDCLKNSLSSNVTTEEKPSAGDKSGKAVDKAKRSEQGGSDGGEKKKETESLRKKIKEHFEVGLGESLSVEEMAEKIDELVNKVINLETAVSSQTALVQRLRTETDELQAQIRTLEEDKATLKVGKNDLRRKIRELEEKLKGIQDLNKNVEDQRNNLQTHFTDANCNLDVLCEKVGVKPDEELERGKGSSKEKSSKKKSKDSDKKTEELEREKGEKKSKDSDKKLKKLEASKECRLSDALEKESSLAEEREGIGSKTVQGAKPEEKEETTQKVQVPQESERRGEKPDHEDGFTKGGNEKLEGRKDVKEGDSITTSTTTHEAGVSRETSKPSEKSQDLTAENKVGEQASSQAADIPAKVESKERVRGHEDEPDWKQLYLKSLEDREKKARVESKEEEMGQEDEPDWKQLYLKGMEDREKSLVTEYTSMLKNYKETKKKLTEVESKNQNGLFEITLQLRELKSTNATKDEEIRLLRHKLSLLEAGMGEKNITDQSVEPSESSKTSVATETSKTLLPIEKDDDDYDLGSLLINQTQATSEIEERFRMSIDELLEENLDFWLRFSTAFHEVHNFETSVKDLMAEAIKLGERQKQEGSSTTKYSLKSEVRPLYKHLREIQTELTVWAEKSALLKEELKNRFSSLCGIQEEITKALKASAEDDDFVFTSYQAAKFQGEILNMKQENNKVADELQAGLDHVMLLQLETERTLAKLSEDWGLSGSRSRPSGQLQHLDSRSRVPLRSFIFDTKPKKQKSLFSYVHPALYWKYSGLKLGNNSSR